MARGGRDDAAGIPSHEGPSTTSRTRLVVSITESGILQYVTIPRPPCRRLRRATGVLYAGGQRLTGDRRDGVQIPDGGVAVNYTCIMTASNHTRPWYCSDDRVSTYQEILRDGGNPTVIQALKVLRTIVLNVLVVALAWFSVQNGGHPTYVPWGAFATLAVVNGFEYSDWAAFREAYQEARSSQSNDET